MFKFQWKCTNNTKSQDNKVSSNYTNLTMSPKENNLDETPDKDQKMITNMFKKKNSKKTQINTWVDSKKA